VTDILFFPASAFLDSMVIIKSDSAGYDCTQFEALLVLFLVAVFEEKKVVHQSVMS
jgi:hypothetical protein